MLYYPKVGEILPMFSEYEGTFTRSVEYHMNLGTTPTQSVMDILMGNVPGAIGAVNILVILVIGVCMLIKHSTSFTALISCLTSVAAISALYPTSMNPKNVVLAAGMGASHTLSPNSEPNARNSLMIPTANAAIA